MGGGCSCYDMLGVIFIDVEVYERDLISMHQRNKNLQVLKWLSHMKAS